MPRHPVALSSVGVAPRERRCSRCVKDAAGKVTGDEKMQAEGKMDKAKGAARTAAGDAKDTARDATR
jgi:hypothetical protein